MNGYWRQGGGVGVLSDRGGGCPTSLAGVKKRPQCHPFTVKAPTGSQPRLPPAIGGAGKAGALFFRCLAGPLLSARASG